MARCCGLPIEGEKILLKPLEITHSNRRAIDFLYCVQDVAKYLLRSAGCAPSNLVHAE